MARANLKYKKLSVYIAPPLPYLGLVSEKAGKFSKLASQGMPLEEKNALTEGVTPDMLKSFGVKLAIVGHSERRALGETNKTVSEKVRTALAQGIIPLLCIGEEEHDAEGEYLDFLRHQLKASLEGVKRTEAGKLMIAYEPIWAIGARAKDVITPRDLAQTSLYIKRLLSDMYGRENAENIPILYGGSVDASNAEVLAKEGNTDGFLVGRASLDHKSFLSIAEELVS
jgi:triosephosphate isomerase